MKAAAAVLGASLLFFFGVLTGAGRQEAIPPPTPIPLGAGNSAASDGAGTPPPSGPSTPGASTPTTRPGSSPSPAVTATTSPTDATAPSGPADPTTRAQPSATSTSTTGPRSDTTAPSTSTTADAGQVEQVDNQVDCRSDRKEGKGKRDPCPPGTGEAPGGGGNR